MIVDTSTPTDDDEKKKKKNRRHWRSKQDTTHTHTQNSSANSADFGFVSEELILRINSELCKFRSFFFLNNSANFGFVCEELNSENFCVLQNSEPLFLFCKQFCKFCKCWGLCLWKNEFWEQFLSSANSEPLLFCEQFCKFCKCWVCVCEVWILRINSEFCKFWTCFVLWAIP